MFAFDAMYDITSNGVLGALERACQAGYYDWEADEDHKHYKEEKFYYDDFDDYY